MHLGKLPFSQNCDRIEAVKMYFQEFLSPLTVSLSRAAALSTDVPFILFVLPVVYTLRTAHSKWKGKGHGERCICVFERFRNVFACAVNTDLQAVLCFTVTACIHADYRLSGFRTGVGWSAAERALYNRKGHDSAGKKQCPGRCFRTETTQFKQFQKTWMCKLMDQRWLLPWSCLITF